MYKIKSFLFVLIGFAVVITLISLLMPSVVVVVKSVSIPAEEKRIYSFISEPDLWKKWYPAVALPETKVHTENNLLSWEDVKGKTYKMRFDIRTDNGVRTILSAENEADIVTDITIYAVDGIPQVEWKSVHTLKWYPWEKFGGIMLKDMVGPGYEQALENLKRVVMFQGE